MTLDDRNIMPTVGTAATVNHHGHQVVHAVQVHGVAGRVEEPELQREDHPVGQLGVPVQLLHVLEPFQVQGQNHGQLLHSHPFLGLLFAAARFTIIFLFTTQCFCVAEVSQTVGNRCILLHIDRKVKKIFIFATNLKQRRKKKKKD